MTSALGWPEWAIALDGGTTNTRARLLHFGAVSATARRAVGVRDAVIGTHAPTLSEAVRDALAELRQAVPHARPQWIVAAGMLTSEVGLAAVPHVAAPADLDALARGSFTTVLPEIDTLPIRFVPGVRTPRAAGPHGWTEADVMRGEECETLGAWLALREQAGESGWSASHTAFLWPGSHTKLVVVDGAGRIERSYTTLAGEMLQALARHTLLAASMPAVWPEQLEPEAMREGARVARAEGLGRSAFLVRIAHLTDAMPPAARAAFWLGAVVADDADHLLVRIPPVPLWVGGRQPLRSLYRAEIEGRHSAPVYAIDNDLAEGASALGALAVAVRAESHANNARISPNDSSQPA
jgi:2-dehydro-3-deoxygalactonokinase